MTLKIKLHKLIACCMICICFQATTCHAAGKKLIWSEEGIPSIIHSADGKDHIVLVGDSIFDCFFWNWVISGTVGRWLLVMLNFDSDLLKKEGSLRVLINGRYVEPDVEVIVQALQNGDRVFIDSRSDEDILNDVPPDIQGESTIDDILKALLKGVRNGERVIVDDRSVEETRASDIASAIGADGDGMRSIPDYDPLFNDYIGRRADYGIAYDSVSPQSARLKPFCHVTSHPENRPGQSMQVDVRADVEGSYVFVSAGGNDLLQGAANPQTIFQNLQEIARRYRELGAKKVIYVIPYSMGGKANPGLWYSLLSGGINVVRYLAKTFLLDKLVPEYYDAVIDLSDFDNRHRGAQRDIPEPTPLGALEIAWRIAGEYRELRHADQGQGATAANSVNNFPGVLTLPSEVSNNTDVLNGATSNDENRNIVLPDDNWWPGEFFQQ